MLDDFDTCADHADLAADICIVGAGAAGITLARALRGRGREILLLESGGPDFEAEVQDLAAGDIRGFDYYPLVESRLRFFGGTTAIWGGRSARLDAIDFQRRAWVPDSGWPFGPGTLAPYYAAAERSLGLDTETADDSAWRRLGLTPPPFDPAALSVNLWQFDEQADRFTLARCRDLIDAADVHVLLHATVTHIRANAAGNRVEQLEIANLRGGRGQVRARAIVLAAGGLEVPRLLLASNDVEPNGLGNAHDLVGRYFMEHPHARGGRVVTDRPWKLLRLLPRSHRRGGRRYATLGRPSEALQQREGLLNTSFTLAARQAPDDRMAATRRAYDTLKHALPPDRLRRNLWRTAKQTVVRTQETIGPVLPWLAVKRGARGIYAILRAEQAPNPDSRVVLTGDRDALGMPRLALDWRFRDIDRASAHGLMAALDRELRRLELGRVEINPWLRDGDTPWQTDPLISGHPLAGYHHMGTTRMADDPRRGVVDGHCRVHGLDNLYVAGSSVFPTGGWANPTLTIIALALRLADHLTIRHDGATTDAAALENTGLAG